MQKFLKLKRKKLFKILHVFTMTAMLLNMSMVGVLFVGTKNASATVGLESCPISIPGSARLYANDCERFGYNTLVAKWEWNFASKSYVVEGAANGTNVTGDDKNANWTADPSVLAVIKKAGTGYLDLPGGTSGTVTSGPSACAAISHLTFCRNTVTVCGNGTKEGTEQCDLGEQNGKLNSGCNADCTNDCKMELTKTDFNSNAVPGEELLYRLVLKNTGLVDCTGSGVELRETYDPKTIFKSANPTPYTGSNNYWNYTAIKPGETKTVDIKMKVATDATCDSTLTNKACVWAKEWGSSIDKNNWVCTEEKTPVVCRATCGDGVKSGTEQCDLGELNGKTNSGCNADCTNDCKMELVKTDFGATAEPGKKLDYKITLKNTGLVNCTGSGVELKEFYDANTTFFSASTTPYSGTNLWNFDTIKSGETKEVSLTVKVANNRALCETELNNKVCAWAEQWGTKDNINNWICTEEKTPVACPSYCGDGITNLGEDCDDGPTGSEFCTADCKKITPSGAIKICKYNDKNANGVYDELIDTPLTWNFRVVNTAVAYDQTLTTEAESGCVFARNLKNGTYTVTEIVPTDADWFNSKPGDLHYDLTLNTTDKYKEAIFLNYKKLGSIKVCKYEDKGVIGTYEAGTDLPKAWGMTLKNASSTVIATTTTDVETGCATFNDLPFGNYAVSEEVKSNWINSLPGSYAAIPVTIDSVLEKSATFLNYQPAGSISGHKYNDANRNGIIEMGEEPLSGWQIQLVRCPYAPLAAGVSTFLSKSSINMDPAPGLTGFCSVVATTTTAIDGSYSFGGLNAGDYGVNEVLTSGWTQSVPAGNKYYYFNLGLNEATSTIDFANYTNPGSIKVCKKIDADGYLETDTDRSTPESAWQFSLLSGETVLQTASTTDDGCLKFDGLSAGTYTVKETQQAGYRVVSPSSGSTEVVLGISENKNVEFLNFKLPVTCSEKIKGYKRNAWTEAGMAGWKINLANETGKSIGTQVTDKDGYFEFGGLCFGTYTVTEEDQYGWEQVTPGKDKDYRFIVNVSWGNNNNVTFFNQPTIHGCKYNDANNNATIDSGEAKLGGWTIELYECSEALPETIYDILPLGTTLGCKLSQTKVTNSETGCYEFKGLGIEKRYYLRELNQSGWSQTYPASGVYQFVYGSGILNSYDFANFQQPYCGDGKCNNNENCGTCSSDCGGCGGGGGGGGGGGDELLIINPQVRFQCGTGATVTWLTSKAATTRLLYDTVSHPEAGSIGAPNYGYASSTTLISEKVTGHTVVLNDLIPGKTYYFRPVSSASPEKIGKEVTAQIATDCCNGPDGTCVIVKGEEGKPVLEIKKENAQSFANPGDKGVEYIITVKNKGNLTAYDVDLNDVLPAGLTYSDDGKITHDWKLGDIKPGESKAVTYKIDVTKDAAYKVYTNVAVAKAVNHEAVSDKADLEILQIKVLAETGFSISEFIYLVVLLFGLAGASIFLKKKIA